MSAGNLPRRWRNAPTWIPLIASTSKADRRPLAKCLSILLAVARPRTYMLSPFANESGACAPPSESGDWVSWNPVNDIAVATRGEGVCVCGRSEFCAETAVEDVPAPPRTTRGFRSFWARPCPVGQGVRTILGHRGPHGDPMPLSEDVSRRLRRVMLAARACPHGLCLPWFALCPCPNCM